MSEILEKSEQKYEKPETKKHDAMNTVQGSYKYYNLYYTTLYYSSLYKLYYSYTSLYYTTLYYRY